MMVLIAKTVAWLLWALVVAIDVAIGTLTFGHVGTVSHFAALARDAGKHWGCWLCKRLDAIDPDHCDEAKADPVGLLDDPWVLRDDWRKILTQAWSTRWMVLAGVFGAIEVMLPFYAETIPRGWFALGTVVAIAGGLIARITAQREFRR